MNFVASSVTHTVAWSMIVIAFSLLLIYSQAQRNRASQAALRVENEDLKKQVVDLQDPIRGVLADKDKRIAELLQQYENASKERDAAVIEKQKSNDAAILSKAQADRATKSQQQAEATLATVQADLDDSRSAYQTVVTRYAASQKEMRDLQRRLAQCGRSTAPGMDDR